MSKKLQLSIPTPCHENWDAMTPVEKGKFCGSCQKQVVDFSSMSDRQVAEFFKKPSTGSVCGRFMTDQLDRDIEIPKKRIPWLRYFFQFAIPAFLLSIKSSPAKAQGTVNIKVATKDTAKKEGVFSDQRIRLGMVARPVYNQPLKGDVKITPVKKPVVDKTVKRDTVVMPEVVISCNSVLMMGKVARPICSKPLMGDTIIAPVKYPVETIKGEISNNVIDERNRTITGKVVDEKGDALPGASIIIKGTRTGVTADNNGAFYLHAKKGDMLQALGPGLEIKEVEVGNDRNIIISVRRIVIGAISIKKLPTKKEIKNVPLMPDIIDDKHTSVFKIFPNPVESGSSINIEIQKMDEGYYGLQLFNQSGQSVHRQEIWIDAEARLLSIDVPPVAAGSYFLSLINKKSGKRFTEKIIVQ